MDVDARSPGLAEALFDDEDPLELLQTPYADRPRLQVLPAGRVPADAPGQLHPRHLARVFEALAAYAGFVVIDSAPLLPVVDTRVLLDTISLDVELIVARAGVTKREDIRNARAIFEQRRLRKSVGLVANAVPTHASYYYYVPAPSRRLATNVARPGTEPPMPRANGSEACCVCSHDPSPVHIPDEATVPSIGPRAPSSEYRVS